MDRNNLISKLIRADEELFFLGKCAPGKKASVVIVGGGALLLHDVSAKQVTKDVDILEIELAARQVLLNDPDFNMGCQAYCMCIPYNFDQRLMEIDLGLTTLRVLTPSLEDLAVMKLYRWEAPDISDLTNPEFIKRIDLELLDRLVYDPNEAVASRIADPENDREFQNLLHNYKTYKEGWL